jgi:hypothetical protein
MACAKRHLTKERVLRVLEAIIVNYMGIGNDAPATLMLGCLLVEDSDTE